MRELTWKEKIIDSQYDNAISKWGEALEYLLKHLPKIEYLNFITLQRGERFKVNVMNLSEDDEDDDTPCIDYTITDDLPKLVDRPREVFLKLLEENGLKNDIFEFNEERLSISVDPWIWFSKKKDYSFFSALRFFLFTSGKC